MPGSILVTDGGYTPGILATAIPNAVALQGAQQHTAIFCGGMGVPGSSIPAQSPHIMRNLPQTTHAGNTAIGKSVVLTPASMANILYIGQLVLVDSGSTTLSEWAEVTAITATTFTVANLLNAHTGTFNIIPALNDPAMSSPGAPGIQLISEEGSKMTYSASVVGFVPVAAATDIIGLIGSATRIIRLLYAGIAGRATAAIEYDVQLVKRSTLNTGSTPADLIGIPHDSTDGASAAKFRQYTTTNPTTGTLVGGSGNALRSRQVGCSVPASGASTPAIFDFTNRSDKAPLLRASTEMFALNMGGATIGSGTTLDIEMMWSEEPLNAGSLSL